MNKIGSIWYAPLAALYYIGVGVRNWLYDHHVFHSYQSSLPTICVGNLAVGGTGKTPHVEWLIRFLSQQYKVAVLSRGYKRKTRGFLLADEHSTAYQIGDECMQLHRKFPNVRIAVCEHRVHGLAMLQKYCPDVQVVVLDDAFQHRRLACGFNILLTTADNLYTRDHFLPWGTLRDHPRQSLRANAIIVTKCPENMTPIDRRSIIHELSVFAYQQLLFSSVRYAAWEPRVANLPASASVMVVAGIAHPEYLMQHVCERFPKAQLVAFDDHHAFTPADVNKLEKLAETMELVLTTEKDIMRLELCTLSDSFRSKLCVVPIEVVILEDDALKSQICRYINKLCIS